MSKNINKMAKLLYSLSTYSRHPMAGYHWMVARTCLEVAEGLWVEHGWWPASSEHPGSWLGSPARWPDYRPSCQIGAWRPWANHIHASTSNSVSPPSLLLSWQTSLAFWKDAKWPQDTWDLVPATEKHCQLCRGLAVRSRKDQILLWSPCPNLFQPMRQ